MSVPPPSEDHQTTDAAERQRSILLVDDERVLLDGLERALAIADMEVVACSNFEDAHRHLRSRPFDVLITDVRLGAFNGLQLAGLARDLYPDMKIVVFSGFDDVVLRQEAGRLDALYVVKPVTAHQLLQMIA
jgi:two-component system response regulator YesN